MFKHVVCLVGAAGVYIKELGLGVWVLNRIKPLNAELRTPNNL